jgi:hypothetical protein
MLDKQQRTATQGFSLIQILDRSFRIYRQNFLPFFVLSSIVQIPAMIALNLIVEPQQLAIRSTMTTGETGTFAFADAQAALGQLLGVYVAIIAIALISAYLEGIFLYGPIAYVASENHLGRNATLGEGFAAVRQRFQTLAGGLGLFYVILVGLGIPFLLPFALCGLGVGLLAYVALGLGALLVPTLLLERTTIGNGLGRSWTLGKASIWKLFAITAGVNIITFLVALALAAVLLQVFKNTTSPIANILSTILGGLGSFLIVPLLPIALTEVYYDVRTRIEGLDMALKATTTPRPSPADVPSPAPGQVIANEDYLNIALFAVGGVVIIILYVMLALSVGSRLLGLQAM